MQFITKPLTTFLIILLIFSAKVSQAQYPGMAAVRQQMSSQFAQQQMQMQMNAMMWLNNGDIPNYKHDYEVILKDSTKIIVKSKIYSDTSLHKTYLLLVDKSFSKSDMVHRERKIFPGETLNISRSGYDAHGHTATFNGMPTDTCWLFKVISANISAYSFLSEQGNYFSYSTITGIQKGDGPIVHFSPGNLKKLIADDPAAMKYFDKKKYDKALEKYNKNAGKAEGK
jgi:hypothetical protein